MSDPVVPDTQPTLNRQKRPQSYDKLNTWIISANSLTYADISERSSKCSAYDTFTTDTVSGTVRSQAAAMRLLQTLPRFDQQMETEAQTPGERKSPVISLDEYEYDE